MKALIDYLEEHVDGKTLATEELIYELENGDLQGVYSDQMSFSNLKYNKSSCQWDMFIVSNEKIWEMTAGKPDKLRKDFSSVGLFRFELAKRRSSGQITGSFRFISATGKDVPANGIVSGIYDVQLGDQVLSLMEDQTLYRDQPIADGKFKAIAFKACHKFYLDQEKLHYHYDGESFDVDTVSLLRKESGDHFPPFVSVEK